MPNGLVTKRTQSELIPLIRNKQFDAILASIPRAIPEVLDCMPVRELLRHGAALNDLEALLAIEIGRASMMLSVGGNLKPGQTLFISRELLNDFPLSSLEDFCLALRRGVKGTYDVKAIWRFDIEVVYRWMRAYSEEVAAEQEKRLKKLYPETVAKSDAAPPAVSKEVDELVERFKQSLAPKDVSRETFTPNPEIKEKYKPASAEDLAMRELRWRWSRECFGPNDAKPNKNYVDFDEWLAIQTAKYERQKYDRDETSSGDAST